MELDNQSVRGERGSGKGREPSLWRGQEGGRNLYSVTGNNHAPTVEGNQTRLSTRDGQLEWGYLPGSQLKIAAVYATGYSQHVSQSRRKQRAQQSKLDQPACWSMSTLIVSLNHCHTGDQCHQKGWFWTKNGWKWLDTERSGEKECECPLKTSLQTLPKAHEENCQYERINWRDKLQWIHLQNCKQQ